ncbi:MAG: L-fuconate dehydratase [Planctomycetes bacterium]|nr:L-fuconate dehydratase [Planctomycetota bacterium]
MKIVEFETRDVRFPTSRERHGSDAMNVDPDYSAAYVVLRTDQGLEGHGLTFTVGRGNELCVAAIEALRGQVVGRSLDDIRADMAGFWRTLVGDTQLRWVGPEKGVVHLATGAVCNAVWDLWAKAEKKPLWRLLCDLSADELVRCIDFRHITDALRPEEARDLLLAREPGRQQRLTTTLAQGFPAYTTSAGWLGYTDQQVRDAVATGIAQGFSHFKMKVGRDLADDIRRATMLRKSLGEDRFLMMDANQVWDVPVAIEWMRSLARFRPLWIEEPTSPDDVLGHRAIKQGIAGFASPAIGVATGEQCHNRVMFKQFLQADALDFVQIDACRVGGVNENLAILLMAAKFGKPVCPHAGGVGLCEYVQHLSFFDYVRVAGSHERRVIEYVDHLHEHFVDPVRIENGRYRAPTLPGFSIEMKARSLADHSFPDGPVWRNAR